MSISESLKSAVQNLRRELKRVNFPVEVDYTKVAQGEPEVFLPILHHAFVDFSVPVAKHLTENGVHLAGKTDAAFITALYSALRDEFGYRPPITADQFFKRSSFAEKKTIMCIDLLQLVRERHKSLSDVPASKPISATSAKLTASASKLADISVSKTNSVPNSARSTSSAVSSGVKSRRSFFVAPSSMKKEAIGVPSLSRSQSQSIDELKASSAKAKNRSTAQNSSDGDNQANVSVSNGVRIVVEKHGVNVASRRSIATASSDFKMPLKVAPRSAAAPKNLNPPTSATVEEIATEVDTADDATDEYLAKKDRRKTMYASYSYSMATKIERSRLGNSRLTSIAERKSIEMGELADKENSEETKINGSEGDSKVSNQPNRYSAKLNDSEKPTAKSIMTDLNNNKSKKAGDTKNRDKPVVVTTIDKTLLETILARLELAETRLRFAERNIESLLAAVPLPQSQLIPTSSDAPIKQVAFVDSEINQEVPVDADAALSAVPLESNTDVISEVSEDSQQPLKQQLNDTDVPFANEEVVLGEEEEAAGHANSTWRHEIEADTL